MKVLIISSELWSNEVNGGNVLTNMFVDSPFVFAQIYCSPGIPNNNICNNYYQLTDSMAIKNFFSHKPIGKSFVLNNKELKNNDVVTQNKKFYSFFKQHRLNIFYTFKSIVWNMSNWKNDKLKKFLDDFNADIIFAPCYGNKFMNELTRFVSGYTCKKVISYISDDSYTLHQFRLSIFYWINRISVRKALRKVFPYYSLCYTMTDIQKKQCEKDFNANMKILLKPVEYTKNEKIEHKGIRLVYAGGLYLNRYKNLLKIRNSIKEINDKGGNIRLDIYTSTELSKKVVKKLNDKQNSIMHPIVSSEELSKIYAKSDIAIHTESFDLKNRLEVRMSFSTKITDCLSSGCAVLAICDKKQGGYVFLKNNNIAICIDDKKKIGQCLHNISENLSIIDEYRQRAKNFVEQKLKAEKIREEIHKDFIDVFENKR